MKFPNNNNQVPTLNDLLSLLKVKSNMLRKMELKFEQFSFEPKVSKPRFHSKEKFQEKHFSKSFLTNNRVCPLCEKSHKIYAGTNFFQMPVNQRIESIRRLKLCINYLNGGHQADGCKFGACKNVHLNTIRYCIWIIPIVRYKAHLQCQMPLSNIQTQALFLQTSRVKLA